MFTLDPRLDADTRFLVRWSLCRVLLMNDRQYPWLILVPEREGLRDMHDLDAVDRGTAMAEIDRASRALVRLHKPHKMNVAALGNVVEQLHIHVIARFTTDAAWPKPVWGVRPAEPYGEADLAKAVSLLKEALS